MNRKSKNKLGLFLLICLTSTVFSSFLLELPQNSPSSAILDNGDLQFTIKEEFYISQFEKLTGIPFVAGDEDLMYSTYLKTVEQNSAKDIAIDAEGYVYITGITTSQSFRVTSGANDTSYNGGLSDVFVCKLNQNGTAVEFCTYVGGSGQDVASAIALDLAGNVYIAGYTTSPDFPVTINAFDTTVNGLEDAFVCKLSADGSQLNYATVMGGTKPDFARDIVLDEMNNVYVTGFTSSPDFPVVNAYDATYNGYGDIFLARLNAEGSQLNFSTFIGDRSADDPAAITLDENGDVFICGYTKSYFYPTTPDALDTYAIWGDGFITGVSANGTSLIYSSCLGLSGTEYATDIAINATGCVFISGYTDSAAFPVTIDAYDTTHNGLNDGFIYVFDKVNAVEVYSSFLGGPADDTIQSLEIGPNNELFLAGNTQSFNFPTTIGANNTVYKSGEDLFICKFNSNLTSLNYSTLAGSFEDDFAHSLVVDTSGDLYLCGTTEGELFPTTPWALSAEFNGLNDGFALKINEEGSYVHYSTLLGYTTGYYVPQAIEIDAFGCAYIAGYTSSTGFPTTLNANQTTYNGGDYDIFVCKLNADATALLYSTYIGGTGRDTCYDLALDEFGCVYITGYTSSTDFPTTPGAMNSTSNGGAYEGYVCKLNADGSTLEYSTYVGGISSDYLYSVLVNDEGQAIVAGHTVSADFPTTTSSINATKNGGYDIILSTLSADGSEFLHSTFFGGSGHDYVRSIAQGQDGCIYLTGRTDSPDFPTSENSFDDTLNGDLDTYVLKLNANYSLMEYSTYFGGTLDDIPEDIFVDDAGSAIVVGCTYSSDFNVTAGSHDTTFNGGSYDGYICKLNTEGTALEFSSFYGGDDSERFYDVALDTLGNIIVTGFSRSPLNATSNAFNPTQFSGAEAEAILCRYTPDGTQITYHSSLGGSRGNYAYALATDSEGHLYIVGKTWSEDFPTSEGAMISEIVEPAETLFVSKIDIQYSPIQIITSNQTITIPQVDLLWEAFGMTHFDLYINEIHHDTVSGTTSTLELWENGEYLVSIKAYDAEIELDISEPVTITVDLTPSPPTILTQENEIQTNFIELSWSEITDAAYYKVYVDETLVGTSVGTFETIVFPENGTYSITVSTVHYGYESEPSSPLVLDVTIPSTVTTDTGDGDDSSGISGFSSSSLILLLFISMGSLIAYVSKKKLVKSNMQ